MVPKSRSSEKKRGRATKGLGGRKVEGVCGAKDTETCRHVRQERRTPDEGGRPLKTNGEVTLSGVSW